MPPSIAKPKDRSFRLVLTALYRNKKNWWWMLMLELAILYIAVVGGLYLLQRKLLYYPDPRPPNLAAAQIPRAAAVQVPTHDGLSLLAWYCPATTKPDTVLLFHGNAGNLDYRADLMRPLCEAGYGVLALAWRGYSGNAGRPSERGLNSDADAAMAWLQQNGIPPAQTVLYGESLGTALAVRAATEEPTVKGVMLLAPFTSMADAARAHFPWLGGLTRYLVRDRYDSLSRIGRLQAPLLILHGEQDQTVPSLLGIKLFQAAPAAKRLILYPQAGHTNLYNFGAGGDILVFLANPPLQTEVFDHGQSNLQKNTQQNQKNP